MYVSFHHVTSRFLPTGFSLRVGCERRRNVLLYPGGLLAPAGRFNFGHREVLRSLRHRLPLRGRLPQPWKSESVGHAHGVHGMRVTPVRSLGTGRNACPLSEVWLLCETARAKIERCPRRGVRRLVSFRSLTFRRNVVLEWGGDA